MKDQIIYIETGAEDSGYDEGKDIALGRFTEFFKEENMGPGTILNDMDIKHIKMIFTLEVEVDGKTETEPVALTWNPLSKGCTIINLK